MFTQAYTTAQQALSQLEQLENEVERYKTQYKASIYMLCLNVYL
jgi:hypothetical protein